MSVKNKLNIIFLVLPALLCIYGLFTKQYHIATNSLVALLCVAALMIFHRKIPVLNTQTYFSVIVLILLSILIGKALKVYDLVPWWDKMLHFMSGFIFISVGKCIYVKLKGNHKNKILMNVFALSFAVAIAGIWEIYEFSIDSIFNLSSQNGSLTDTMWDMILGTVSSLMSIILVKEKSPDSLI